ncbi:AraC family transcriptional regulator [Variovorax sp. J22G73]|jgi:AraC-like DNA-binding protein/quercetin dioxygenase-like cupin family protein|uniref:helix-turn-helix transcriptional regulator n=1 Tax=unclassified Variovorax TaxID=663243 RepID=UPI000D5FB6F9|nr:MULTISPECIES: AraC family transcriptional regulator [unclassified Variovorax]MDM0006054.1 AraC family transcriptional regulator [Variovorax sp. J22R203]MDM0097922.1 AraC family transcriptional regulator [Variovorax sp. J22G73]
MTHGAASRVISLPMEDGAQVEAMFAADPKAHFDLHWHAEWSVGAILEGRCEFTCAGERQLAEAGDLVVMAPGMLHTAGVSAQGFRMVMLYVPQAWVAAQLGWPEARRGVLHCAVRRDAAAAQALASAARAEDGATLGRLLARVLRAQTGRELVAVERQLSDARVEAVCRALATEDACRIDPGALALRLGMSREHFHRLFRVAVGMTPAHYARLARICRAKVLLREGQAAAEVAAQCGFTDQAHFSRWFRRCFGVTPGNYMAVRGRVEKAA